jgi:hypothetical protein
MLTAPVNKHRNKEHRNAMQPGFQQNISQKLCHEGAFVSN